MAVQGADKMKFDKAIKSAESHMSWVERALEDPGSNEGAVATVAQRTAAAQVWATLANAHASKGGGTPQRSRPA